MQGLNADARLQILAAAPTHDRDEQPWISRQTLQQPLRPHRYAHFRWVSLQLYQRAVEIEQQRTSLRIANAACNFAPRAKQIARRTSSSAMRRTRNDVGMRMPNHPFLFGPDLQGWLACCVSSIHNARPSSGCVSSIRISESSVIRLPAHANTLWRITLLRISLMRVCRSTVSISSATRIASAGRSGELAQNQRAFFIVARRDEFFGHQVHPVVQ